MAGGRYERIEPSPRYDGQTARLLGRAIAASNPGADRPGPWQVEFVKRPQPGPRTRRWLAERGIVLNIVDDGGLTAWQRAFVRSLYYVHNDGAGGKRNPVWSLEVRWAPAPSPGGHEVAVRLWPVALAAEKKARMRARDQWAQNYDLQSGGAGSVKQRFA